MIMLCSSENLLGRTMISSMMFNLDFLTILDEDDDEIFKKKRTQRKSNWGSFLDDRWVALAV